MKTEPVIANVPDIEQHLKRQAERQAAARTRLAVVDRRYREYTHGAKPA